MSGDPGVVMKIIRNNELREQSLIDPVGKFRVCEPQTLIDTDFEYGLQTTKWETLELVNNIPTFYSRDNDESLALSNVTTVADSYNVYVHTLSNHGLIVGSPVIVQGVNSFSAEGSYVVNAVINTTQFVYRAKALQTVTGTIFDDISTQVYIGKLYQGSQYNLDALGYIRTNGTNQIVVDTLSPHGFTENTSFILSKSVGQKQLVVANSNVDIIDSFSLSNSIPMTSNNMLSNVNPYLQDNVIIHKWTGKQTAFVDNTDVNNSTNTITSSNHGFLTDDFVMYVPPPLTLSNIDAAYRDEDNARTPDISTFNVSSPYTYTYDGTTNTISTGGSSMFAAGANNAHYFGTSTLPTTQLSYATSNWTIWDSGTDYRTFGQSVPYCTVIRHMFNSDYYYRVDVPSTGAQAGTVHDRFSSSGLYNNFRYQWTSFGLYNNGSRPSFHYVFLTFRPNDGNVPACVFTTATSTATTSSLQYVARINNNAGYTWQAAYTVVMLVSRQNGARITSTDVSSLVTRCLDFHETFTGVMGFYRPQNAHIYNYLGAGDSFMNDGGGLFDNNNQGNQFFIDGQRLSYRDRQFTTLINTTGVDYKFISGCVPQIMFSRVYEPKWVQYRMIDKFDTSTGAVDTGNWTSGGSIGSNGWNCRYGYYGLYGRGSRPSLYRLCISFTSSDAGYPNYSNSWVAMSTTNMDFYWQTYTANQYYPMYVAILTFSQVNGGALSSTFFQHVTYQFLQNAQLAIINNTPTWALGLVRHNEPSEYNEFNTIGGLRPMEVYQVLPVNAHQFQLQAIPRWDTGSYMYFSNTTLYYNTMTYPIDIITNFFSFGSLSDNNYFRYYNINSGSTGYWNYYYSYINFIIEILDEFGTVQYSYSDSLGPSNGYYVSQAGWRWNFPLYLLGSFGYFGNATDPVRRYTQIRVRATYHNYGEDRLNVQINDYIPAFRYAPLSSRVILPITQGNTREYIGKHAFMKAYRTHFFANSNSPGSTNNIFNVLRKGNDPLAIEANDAVYMFQHPYITNIESSRITATNARTSTPQWTSYGGPGIPRSYTSVNSYPSVDNLKAGNSFQYTIESVVSVQNAYTSFRIRTGNGTFGSHNTRWWPGTSWFVLARNNADQNTIYIPNHGITNNLPLQLENVNPSLGIREIPSGTYFAERYTGDLIRLRATVNGASLDMSAFDAGSIRLFYTLNNANRDTFFVRDHGLFQGTPLTYTSSSLIHPLINATTYYATNVSRDRFSVSTVVNGSIVNLGGTQLFEDVSNASSIGTGNIISTISNITLNTIGTGTGTTGGFLTPNGGSYLFFNGAGTRELITKTLDLSLLGDGNLLTTLVIRGTGTNGGAAPSGVNKELRVDYRIGGGAWTAIGVLADIVVASSWTPRTITIPTLARVSNASLRIYQTSNSGANNDNYGIQYIRIDNNVSLTPTDLHYFAVGGTGAVDGTYVTTSMPLNSRLLTLTAPFNLPPKTLYVIPANIVNFKDNTLYLPNHNMRSGALVKYQVDGGSAMSPLQDDTEYYATRVDENHIRLSTTYDNAVAGTNITITTLGTVGASGRQIFLDYSVGGEIISAQNATVSVTNGSRLVTGSVSGLTPITQFTSDLRVGNFMNIVVNSGGYDDYYVSSINSATFTLTILRYSDNSINVTFATGDAVIYAPPTPRLAGTPVNSGSLVSTPALVKGQIYYAVVSSNTMRLFSTLNDALTSQNVIQITGGGGVFTSLRPSTVITRLVTSIRNNRFLEVNTPFTTPFTGARYLLSTNLFVKADGFAMHRPYDGGVELIPPKNSDSQMIRQTRKYFRYQSGKGIQVSLAVNFSAPVDIDSLGRTGGVATLVTRRPHRLSPGVSITVEGSTESTWNGSYTIVSTPTDTSFTFNLGVIPSSLIAPGTLAFYVNSWNNSFLRCGLFDDQNGMFYEYDGNQLCAVRRNSVQQLSGTCTATFNSPVIEGNNTSFATQLAVNDMIVLKGMSYKVISIFSNTRLFIQPVYRGITRDEIIITKTIETRVPQSQWTIDRCDGTGPTGFALNVNRIQMAYMDYSWYGAGKVRFGFKDRNGEVRYVHEFIHNNYLNEAYLRSGNLPCRYEVVNKGFPTYTPALMHWGTSVIMDGKFDDDKAYLFTAAGQLLSYSTNNTSAQTAQTTQVTVNNVSSINYIFGGVFNRSFPIYDSSTRTNVNAFAICAPSSEFSKVSSIRSGTPITLNWSGIGEILPVGTTTVSQPVLYSGIANYGTVIWISKAPTQGPFERFSVGNIVTATIGNPSEYIPPIIPLISIRLAPSVDNSRPGVLGSREIMNRMQLILKTVGILTTHDCEIRLLLNGSIDNRAWQRVTSPSLSQLVYHVKEDAIDNGTQIFNFRISGGSADSTGKRAAVGSTFDLDELVTLGNSILGGDGIFPDGPDILTICASILDLSGITSTTPFTITGRVTWTESQA